MKRSGFLLAAALCLIVSSTTATAAITSAASGNWSAPATWVGGVVPGAGDDVIIAGTHTVTVDVDSACNNLTLNSGGTGTRLTLTSTRVLSVNGTLNSDTTGLGTSLITGAGVVRFVGGSRALFGTSWAANPPSWSFEAALTPGSTGTATTNIKAGNITITSGTFQVGTSGSPRDLRPDNNAANTGTLSVASGGTLIVTGSISRTGTLTNQCASVTIDGTLELGGSNISALNINVNNGGKLRSTRTGGHTVTGTLSYAAGSTLEYAGTAAQTTSGEYMGTLSNLTINNPSGVSITFFTSSIEGTLTLTTGNISLGGNALFITSTGTVSRTSGHVIGNFGKSYAGVGSKTFEVGTANGYSPVEVNVTAGSFPALFTIKATQGPHPNIVTPQAALQRYWTLGTGASITADLTFNYLDADVPPPPTSENSFVIFKYNGAWTMPGGSVNPGANTATITGVTSFSDWTLAQPSAPTAASSRISGVVTTADGRPLGGVTVNLGGSHADRTITDRNGFYRFSNVETNGFYTVTPGLANYSFSPSSRSFSLVADRTDAVFTATADSTATENPLNGGDFFVRQQYLDFLGREPDRQGWLFWSEQISRCGGDINCVRQRRIDISAAFFASDEFQQGGNYVYRLYRAGLGRRLSYTEFSEDRQQVVGGPELEASRTAFAESFVQRAEFVQKYQDVNSGAVFVDRLLQTVLQDAGLDLSSQRNLLIEKFNAGADETHSRSAVVMAVAEVSEYKTAVYNSSFVLMEYFGYLRRGPDTEGYNFWVDVLDHRDRGNYRGMVCSFLTSAEYQRRFSSVVTHSNVECGQ